MIDRRAALLALSLTALISLWGCAKPKPVRVTPRSAAVTAIGPTGVTLDVNLDVYNPNSFALYVQKLDGVLRLGSGVEIARGSAEPKNSIAANATSSVPASLTVAWTNLGALLPFAMSGGPAPYHFEGVATIGGSKLNVGVPFAIDGEITRAQLLQAGLRGLTR